VSLPLTSSSAAPTVAAQVAAAVVGRERETELLEAALAAGADVVLEGPPGTGKSTLLRAVATARSTTFVLVEGNAELTPARVVGQFDPAQVLEKGYCAEIFVDGPLLVAMRTGGLFYVEELNRVPEETLNTLLAVMSEREIVVPRLGTVTAEPGFAVVAAMNPYDAVGTARVSGAVYDRTCRIAMDYQSAEAEAQIVLTRATAPALPRAWADRVVDLVRRTRSHVDLRVGSSVRGAIDLGGLAHHLAAARGRAVDDWHVGLDAALVALSGRVRIDDGAGRRAEEIIAELYRDVFGAPPSNDDGDGGSDEEDRSPGER
jgi:MoxR-like ATPase